MIVCPCPTGTSQRGRINDLFSTEEKLSLERFGAGNPVLPKQLLLHRSASLDLASFIVHLFIVGHYWRTKKILALVLLKTLFTSTGQ